MRVRALAGFAQPEPVLRTRRAGGVLRCAGSREFASRAAARGQSQVDGLGVVLLAEPVLGEAECRGEFLDRFALGALAYDEGGGGFLGEPAEFGDGDDEVGGRGVRVVRPVEQFLGAHDEVFGDVADRLVAAGGPAGVDSGLGSRRAVRVGL
ncbi:hypothetical protein [Streptomyces sp. MBT60]|uniref:hypothetical protein n=1 Tax=Streptomyces sp. MBT60 TaxID=2800409 RepID=UPI00190E4250|nr:hypothetical protein [Streptomyces sp. MBT60]MBK3543393.1 hypothetical protein [Streptomyces sp. MBT60]